jgi:hypothetical protein
MMRRVWKEPRQNRELISSFGLDDTQDLPCVVIFVLDGVALERATARIDDSTLEAVYASLKAIFVEVDDTLRALPAAVLRDSSSVLDAVKSTLRSRQYWRRVTDAYRVLKELRDWTPFF